MRKRPDTLDVLLAQLYRSEINVSISTFWDEGWEVKLGDEINGFVAETTIECPTDDITTGRSVETVGRGIAAIVDWLDEQAREHFPSSEYTKNGGRSGHDCGESLLVPWTVSSHGQYGWGCPVCRMFVCAPRVLEGDLTLVAVCPLDEVIFPPGYERVPAYRRLVGLAVVPA